MTFFIISTFLIFFLIVASIFSFVIFAFDIFLSTQYDPKEMFILFSLFAIVNFALVKGLVVLNAYKYFLKKIKQKEVK